MTKAPATLVCYMGKHLYHCDVYTDKLIETHSLDGISSDALHDFFATRIKKHAIQQVTFNFAVESLLVVAVPWSSEFILRPKAYIELFTRPIVPESHDLADYYYWYDVPQPNQTTYVIATHLATIRPMQTLIKSLNPAIKFDYRNEISTTLTQYAHTVKRFNAIIPSIHQQLAIATLNPTKGLSFLTTLPYQNRVDTTTLEQLKVFLMVKLPNWVETATDADYKILTPNLAIKPTASYLTPLAKKSSIMVVIAGLLAIGLVVYGWGSLQQMNALAEQKQQIESHNQQLKQQSVTPHQSTHTQLLPLLQRIDVPAFQDIYIQKASSNNLQDKTTAILLSGKTSSFLALDDYITRLKKDQQVLNVDIITSFEDKSTVPTTISFEIKINLTNPEGL